MINSALVHLALERNLAHAAFRRQVLQLAVAVFMADQAVFRMIREEQLDHRPPRFNHARRIGPDLEPVPGLRRAGRHVLRAAGDRGRPAPRFLDHADAAGSALEFDPLLLLEETERRDLDAHRIRGV